MILTQNCWMMHFFQKGGIGVICAKGPGLSCASGKPIFTFKENDEGVIPREDVHKKLPTPQKLGGTARREQKCIFPCSIDKWDVM